MIVTTTGTVDGQKIGEYIRVVSGEVILGANMFKDIAAGFRNVVGGRAEAYESELRNAREGALKEMVEAALALGATGIVGVKLDYQTVGANGSMLMVAATGTAVRFV
ncbi:MAG: heavy metal-binding domain-containing protein [Corynebacterium sp.]|nr:heavy metal-binding domain-containing protein [Corynebacterium sp.]